MQRVAPLHGPYTQIGLYDTQHLFFLSVLLQKTEKCVFSRKFHEYPCDSVFWKETWISATSDSVHA